jgi:aminopeptidase-like protein
MTRKRRELQALWLVPELERAAVQPDPMDVAGWSLDKLIADDIGGELFAFAAGIFPICRSITGDGVRQTLREVGAHIALDIHEVPTGTAVFDWTIPREWNIRDAYIKNEQGEKVVDFGRSNLHVMSYSVPVQQRLSLGELKQHLYSLPDQPDLIPYRTSYYSENWAFCISHRQLEALRDETYEVVIDSSLADGHLTYGEYLHKGETDEEFLLSVHVCHPSLADDNCSGIALLTHLAKRMIGVRTPTVLDFSPYGYDERQYCSPGFNLPVGLFQRSKFGAIPEYHTSADNLGFIRPDHLRDSYRLIVETINVIENDAVFLNTMPKCEPQLGKRGLYGAVGGDKDAASANMAMLWILNQSDGAHSLLDIAERANLPFAVIQRTAQLLRDHGLLKPLTASQDQAQI